MKGMSTNAFIAIILGIIAILIILGAFGQPLLNYSKNIFDKIIPSVISKEPAATVPGTAVKELQVRERKLTGTHDEIKDAITSELLACWNQMERGKRQNEKCVVVILEDEKFTRAELVSALKAKSERAGTALDDNWGTGDIFSRGNELPGRTGYLICADYDRLSRNDLYLTNQRYYDCE
ncbi:Uncharacterised protein [uncultured archaeon]|nr:Uncharacterised protein [uncultured archaeon]